MTTPAVSVDTLFSDATLALRELPLVAPTHADEASGPDPVLFELPRLVPTRPPATRDWFLTRLQEFSIPEAASSRFSNVAATALNAGLLLWHDYLDESHELAQSIEGEGENRLGDYWHAILHRREPDYANSKYWFRHVGRQPIFDELERKAVDILSASRSPEATTWRDRLQSRAGWDPFAFVDLCEACARDESTELALVARRIQLAEMALLLEFTRARL